MRTHGGVGNVKGWKACVIHSLLSRTIKRWNWLFGHHVGHFCCRTCQQLTEYPPSRSSPRKRALSTHRTNERTDRHPRPQRGYKLFHVRQQHSHAAKGMGSVRRHVVFVASNRNNNTGTNTVSTATEEIPDGRWLSITPINTESNVNIDSNATAAVFCAGHGHGGGYGIRKGQRTVTHVSTCAQQRRPRRRQHAPG